MLLLPKRASFPLRLLGNGCKEVSHTVAVRDPGYCANSPPHLGHILVTPIKPINNLAAYGEDVLNVSGFCHDDAPPPSDDVTLLLSLPSLFQEVMLWSSPRSVSVPVSHALVDCCWGWVTS